MQDREDPERLKLPAALQAMKEAIARLNSDTELFRRCTELFEQQMTLLHLDSSDNISPLDLDIEKIQTMANAIPHLSSLGDAINQLPLDTSLGIRNAYEKFFSNSVSWDSLLDINKIARITEAMEAYTKYEKALDKYEDHNSAIRKNAIVLKNMKQTQLIEMIRLPSDKIDKFVKKFTDHTNSSTSLIEQLPQSKQENQYPCKQTYEGLRKNKYSHDEAVTFIELESVIHALLPPPPKSPIYDACIKLEKKLREDRDTEQADKLIDAILAFSKYRDALQNHNDKSSHIFKHKRGLLIRAHHAFSKCVHSENPDFDTFTALTKESTNVINQLEKLRSALNKQRDPWFDDPDVRKAGRAVYFTGSEFATKLLKRSPNLDDLAELSLDLKYARKAVNSQGTDKEDQIALKLEECANKAPGKKHFWKKFSGTLLILGGVVGGAVTLGLSIAATPFTGGASLLGGAALTACGATLFYKGTRRGFSKDLNKLAEKAKASLQKRSS